ncbi:MAG: hypothetical protein JW999_12255 [Methanotrichaceae archaeon]|nr:hypothetical protein [Methanotrichaceae archaeon]
MTEIEKIAGPLRELLCEREIIARCELLLRTYDIVRSAKLSDQERKELVETVGERIAPGVFASIMGKEPIFVDLPKLDTYTQINGRIFHFPHTKRYSKQDFANANSKLLRSLPELKIILQQCLVDRLTECMVDAGYTLTAESRQELTFSAEKHTIKAFAVTSVKSLDIDNYNPESGIDYIILVPSSETLEPFLQFFREHGKASEDKGLQIWIMNLEKGTVDPFIGYTTDLDIYNQFDNPRLAEMVRNNWSQSNSQ